MSSSRIDRPPGGSPSVTSNQTVGDIASTTSNAWSVPPKTDDHPQDTSKTTGALKQRGSEIKSQQNVTANVVKHDLEKQLGKLPNRPITIDSKAGNDQLAKIHVKRDVQTTPPKTKMATEYVGNEKNPRLYPAHTEPGSETSTTRFPNGVGFKTKSTVEENGKRIVTQVTIEPPPGGKVVSTADGTVSTIYDASGKVVGKMVGEIGKEEMELTLNVHTKEGEYVQSTDGQIRFTPKTQTK